MMHSLPVRSGPTKSYNWRPTALLLACLGLFFVTQYAEILVIPFLNDDYVILERVRGASFWDLWRTDISLFAWYRPWSREVHYWTLLHLFGPSERAFHVVSAGLWVGVLVAYYAVVRHVAGVMAAAIAAAGLMALTLWGSPLYWAAGAQDLWMLLFGLAFLWADARRKPALAFPLLALALLSKESAAILPGIAMTQQLFVDRRPWREVLARVVPYGLLVAVWAFLHPTLGDRFFGSLGAHLTPANPLATWERAFLGLLSQWNLDQWPAPMRGWAGGLVFGVVGAGILSAYLVLTPRIAPARKAWSPEDGGRREFFFIVWAVLGLAPSWMPSIEWHAYYGVLGALGVWALLGFALQSRPGWAVALVAAVALIRPIQADTPTADWGSAWYQRRAGILLGSIRDQLYTLHPTLAPHTRLYFYDMPGNIGMIAGDGPAVRVWYGDSTLTARYISQFSLRSPDAAAGEDRFFRFDEAAGLVELHTGAQDLSTARRQNPRWEEDHRLLASVAARAGAFGLAVLEYEKLAAANPQRGDYNYLAALCYAHLGLMNEAEQQIAEAATRSRMPDTLLRGNILANLAGKGVPYDSLQHRVRP